MANPDRMAYVGAADVLKVIDACPDHEWKLVFALARFAGARTPSEVRGLTWADVNHAAGKLTLHSPKTEHHEGRGERVVPIAPELAPLLLAAFEAAEDGAMHALPRLRHGTNLATTAKKIIRRAQLVPWPRTFQNLRSSCETDWAVLFPIHVACAWAGNTQAVAAKHYLQVTDEDYRRAASSAAAGHGIGRNRPEPQNVNPLETRDLEQSNGPRGTTTLPRNLAKRLGVSKAALHRALQRAAVEGLGQLRAAVAAGGGHV
jgi:integrase